MFVYDQSIPSLSQQLYYQWDLSSSQLQRDIYPASQPLMVDLNGDQLMDILYQDPKNGI